MTLGLPEIGILGRLGNPSVLRIPGRLSQVSSWQFADVLFVQRAFLPAHTCALVILDSTFVVCLLDLRSQPAL